MLASGVAPGPWAERYRERKKGKEGNFARCRHAGQWRVPWAMD